MNGPDAIGFAGLGQMGGPMAGNIAAAGLSPVVYDKAGTADRAPAGSVAAESFEDLVRRCDTLFLSLPDGTYCLEAARALIQCQERRPTVVFDLSTIGPPAAREIDRVLGENGIIYVDAPVSGGAAGANGIVRTLELLETEIRIGLGLLGVRSFSELTVDHLCPEEPVGPSDVFSAFPLLFEDY